MRRIACLFALILGLAVNASAGVIVYDGFDYAAGSLGGKAGGTGWDAGVAWDGGQTVTSPGLEWPGLPFVGNKVTSTSTASFRLMPAGFSALNRTLWFSFICQNSATPSWCGISPFNGSGSEALFIGKPDTSAYWGLALYNSMSDSGAVTGAKLSTVPVGELAFFVVRIINGASSSRITAWINPGLGSEPTVATAFYDSETAGEKTGRVPFDRIRISGAGQALFYDELRIGETYADIAGSARGLAISPSPEDESTDVPLDSTMSWTAGEFAATHDVYFGTTFDDVNNASRTNPLGVLVGQGQAAAEYTPDLEYGLTYYWRIDEVNAAPDNTIIQGKVWSFTAEPYAYPITNVTATASSAQASLGPENTINGSGLNDADQHSTEIKQMWMTTGLVKPDWIQYEFADVCKLQEMWVWNSNQALEAFLGFGAKSVTIEYSTDGQTWTTLEGVTEFAKATATATYTHNTTVDFGGALAKFVKITINSNWGGAIPQTGLSEVRFFAVPVKAFEPVPAVEATNVSVDTELSWRPGREAASHKVYIGTDSAAVAAGTVAAGTTTDRSYTPASLDFATTYFWKVDEVGDAGTYAGDVWS
ncbi:MAG: discoidin domain-containing protein, partial [Solirubrobacterales bacterium]